MKNVRNTQPCISMNFFSKAQVLACEYRLVLDLPTSILVRASVSLLTFHTSTILAPLWFTNIPEPFHSISLPDSEELAEIAALIQL